MSNLSCSRTGMPPYTEPMDRLQGSVPAQALGKDQEDGICTCPFCRRVLPKGYVNLGRTVHYCCKCGHTWMGKTAAPKRCPKCGTARWLAGTKEYRCKRCGHEWVSRVDGVPSRCPSCNSQYWNSKPRKRKPAADSEAERKIKARKKMEHDRQTDMNLAAQRCAHGEDVIAVASELSVPLLDLILELRSRKIRYELRRPTLDHPRDRARAGPRPRRTRGGLRRTGPFDIRQS